jgi:hypothetical protein
VTYVIGVDPGVSGAIAFWFSPAPDRIAVYDTPIAGGEVNTPGVASLIRDLCGDPVDDTIAYIERVHSMPGNSGRSMFNFGTAYGDVRGVIGALRIPTHFVTPQMWKKQFRLSADKEESRALAIRMFPSCADSFKLKKHDGRAEAALIALYGSQIGAAR